MRSIPLRLLPVLLISFLGCHGPSDEAGPAVPGQADARVVYGDSLPGAELAAALGCGACHPGAPAPEIATAKAPDLRRLEGWNPAALAAYLRDPVQRRSTIARMPDFGLDEAEAAAVTLHLLRGASSRPARAGLRELADGPPGVTKERGAAIVAALNCAGCHEGTGVGQWAPAPPLAGIGARVQAAWLTSYLREPRAIRPFGYHPGSGSRMPAYELSAAEVDSLVGWLLGAGAERAGADPAASGASTRTPSPDLPPTGGLSAFQAGKAEALLRGHLSCLGCHGLRGGGGRVAPALDGASARLRPEYLRRVVRQPQQAAAGSIMPQPLEDSATLALITAYLLQGAPPVEVRADTTTRPARPDHSVGSAGSARRGYLSLIDNPPLRPDLSASRDPASLYARHCAACHGIGGAGDGFNAPHLPSTPTAHADPRMLATRADATLFDGIHGGGHILGKSHRMPGFGATITPEEIRGLVAHIRRLCACEQPGWAVAP